MPPKYFFVRQTKSKKKGTTEIAEMINSGWLKKTAIGELGVKAFWDSRGGEYFRNNFLNDILYFSKQFYIFIFTKKSFSS